MSRAPFGRNPLDSVSFSIIREIQARMDSLTRMKDLVVPKDIMSLVPRNVFTELTAKMAMQRSLAEPWNVSNAIPKTAFDGISEHTIRMTRMLARVQEDAERQTRVFGKVAADTTQISRLSEALNREAKALQLGHTTAASIMRQIQRAMDLQQSIRSTVVSPFVQQELKKLDFAQLPKVIADLAKDFPVQRESSDVIDAVKAVEQKFLQNDEFDALPPIEKLNC